MKIAILILAAGSSTRMGTPKQLLAYKQNTLLGYTIEQAKKSKANAVFCVLGANAELIKNSISTNTIKTIFNPNFKEGLSSSIYAGVDYLKDNYFDAVLILLADQPNVTTRYINKMLLVYQQHTTKIIVSNYKKEIGVPVIFPSEYFTDLLKLNGDKGAKLFLEKKVLKTIKMNPLDLIDIDTFRDYQNLIKNVSLS